MLSQRVGTGFADQSRQQRPPDDEPLPGSKSDLAHGKTTCSIPTAGSRPRHGNRLGDGMCSAEESPRCSFRACTQEVQCCDPGQIWSLDTAKFKIGVRACLRPPKFPNILQSDEEHLHGSCRRCQHHAKSEALTSSFSVPREVSPRQACLPDSSATQRHSCAVIC